MNRGGFEILVRTPVPQLPTKPHPPPPHTHTHTHTHTPRINHGLIDVNMIISIVNIAKMEPGHSTSNKIAYTPC